MLKHDIALRRVAPFFARNGEDALFSRRGEGFAYPSLQSVHLVRPLARRLDREVRSIRAQRRRQRVAKERRE